MTLLHDRGLENLRLHFTCQYLTLLLTHINWDFLMLILLHNNFTRFCKIFYSTGLHYTLYEKECSYALSTWVKMHVASCGWRVTSGSAWARLAQFLIWAACVMVGIIWRAIGVITAALVINGRMLPGEAAFLVEAVFLAPSVIVTFFALWTKS